MPKAARKPTPPLLAIGNGVLSISGWTFLGSTSFSARLYCTHRKPTVPFPSREFLYTAGQVLARDFTGDSTGRWLTEQSRVPRFYGTCPLPLLSASRVRSCYRLSSSTPAPTMGFRTASVAYQPARLPVG